VVHWNPKGQVVDKGSWKHMAINQMCLMVVTPDHLLCLSSLWWKCLLDMLEVPVQQGQWTVESNCVIPSMCKACQAVQTWQTTYMQTYRTHNLYCVCMTECQNVWIGLAIPLVLATMKMTWLIFSTGIIIEMLRCHRDFDWKTSIMLKHFLEQRANPAVSADAQDCWELYCR
jgi:hypothetical protein